MKMMFSYIIFFLKIPAFLLTRIYNFILLKSLDITYGTYPAISGKLMIKGEGKFIIGKNLRINSSLNSNPVGLVTQTVLFAYKNSKIVIGNNVGMSNVLICSMNEIIIEDNILLGGGCQIFDNDFHSIKFIHRNQNPDIHINKLPVLIKSGAFIGCNSIICKGVTIGERSIIAAGSVVVKNVPNDEIWGGNPAKFIKKIEN